MKRILFFATKEDILLILNAVEQKGPLRYVRMDHFTNPVYESFARGAEIPNLGKASAASAISCDSFLISESTVTTQVRPIKTAAGVERFCVDQLVNPDTVTFTPGGIWNEDILLHGRIATVSESQASQELMKRFRIALNKDFTKIKSFLVGPKALTLLKAGKRLTISAQSPQDFDLTTAP
jgi:hypothetical protein